MDWTKVNGDIRYGFTKERGFPMAPEAMQLSGASGDMPLKVIRGSGIPVENYSEARPSKPAGINVKIPNEKQFQTDFKEYSFTKIPIFKWPDKDYSKQQFEFDYGMDPTQYPFSNLDSEQGCSSTSVCSECPTRAAPCDFETAEVFYPPVSDLQIRSTLRTGADGRLAEQHPRLSYGESFTDSIQVEGHDEVFEKPHSRHASHCDLREFREYREANGSRESISGLPPDLVKHLRECKCSCDHLGFGNYKTMMVENVAHISRAHSCGEEAFRKEITPDYTQISYADSPRSTSSSGNVNRIKVPGELSTKHWYIIGLLLVAVVAAGVGVSVPLAFRGDPSQSLDRRLELAKQILAESPLIDGHNDLPWNIRSFIHNQLEKIKLNESLKTVEPWSVSNWSHTDIPRLKDGMVGGVFWAAYTPCATQYLNAVQLTLEQIDIIKRVIKKYKEDLQLVTESEDVMKAFKRGKIASMIGIEGGHSISSSLGSLRMMYELGVRYITLTHACNTPWATSSIVESDKMHDMKHVGLNDFGKKIVLEMNRLGMMVDLSHVSTQTMKDALATTLAPVIFSHSSARYLCEKARNVPDDVLLQVKNNRGIVMVTFFAEFVKCNGVANVSHVAEHINHIRNVAGIDHVGIGADFDGINKTPIGLEDVSKYPNLIAELLKDPRWTVEDLRKLIGENIIRVFSEVEIVRDRLQKKGYEPFEEEIHPDYLRSKTNCTYFFD